MFYYYATAKQSGCPSAMPTGVTSAPNSAGPAGPTIGDQTVNDPNTTIAGTYAPAFVERFTILAGNTLKLFYMISTWNPYTNVMMESDFNVAYGPAVTEVANAEGESPSIAPNTWVEIKGSSLSPAGDSRIWQGSDFAGNSMPTELDKVGVTVNGKSAYVYYISPTQINVLTPPDAMSGAVQVVVNNGGIAGAAFTAQAQALSPSLFDYLYNGSLYVAAVHTSGAAVGPAGLASAGFAPARPGETIMLYANGFGPTSVPVQSGSAMQSGSLPALPVITIGGVTATVEFAGLVAPGQFQFNVVIPPSLANGDQPITASYGGLSTQAGALIPVQH